MWNFLRGNAKVSGDESKPDEDKKAKKATKPDDDEHGEEDEEELKGKKPKTATKPDDDEHSEEDEEETKGKKTKAISASDPAFVARLYEERGIAAASAAIQQGGTATEIALHAAELQIESLQHQLAQGGTADAALVAAQAKELAALRATNAEQAARLKAVGADGDEPAASKPRSAGAAAQTFGDQLAAYKKARGLA